MMRYEIPRSYLLLLGEQTSVPHAKSLRLPVADPIRGGLAFEQLITECMGAPK